MSFENQNNKFNFFISENIQKRKHSLFKQKNLQRENLLENARKIFKSDNPPEIQQKNINKNIKNSRRKNDRIRIKRAEIASQFMIPEWMIDIPYDFGSDWLFYPIPSGTHCIVTASNNKTSSHKLDGRTLHASFPSILPNGSKKKTPSGRSSNLTLLDCIYNFETQTYFVRDVLFWNSVSFNDSEAEFRLYWVRSKLEEKPFGQKGDRNRFSFVSVGVERCCGEALKKVYAEICEKEVFGEFKNVGENLSDGLQFIHRQSAYLNGANPLMLKWKDEKSVYFKDGLEFSSVCLKLDLNNNLLLTQEGFAVSFDEESIFLNDEEIINGSVLKFRFSSFNALKTDSGVDLKFVDLEFMGVTQRIYPHLFSRMIFQNLVRSQKTITFEKLLEAVENF